VPGEAPPTTARARTQAKGALLTRLHGVGLALLRGQDGGDVAPVFTVDHPDVNLQVTPFRPDWWPEEPQEAE
jgi:hypothetical protein